MSYEAATTASNGLEKVSQSLDKIALAIALNAAAIAGGTSTKGVLERAREGGIDVKE